MDKSVRIVNPRYQQIAADIAARIVNGHYQVGERVYASSSLASQYGVSAETARRAICVLADMKIVDAERGSGVVIASLERAREFVARQTQIRTVSDLEKEIVASVESLDEEFRQLKSRITGLIDKTSRFRAVNPFMPYEIVLGAQTPCLGKSIAEVNFWHHTAATIVAIQRDGSLILSPGPYSVFMEHDVLYYIGDDGSPERVQAFLSPQP
ncbi:MAG: GntR family transcriptional regulator [Bacillota bacterium]